VRQVVASVLLAPTIRGIKNRGCVRLMRSNIIRVLESTTRKPREKKGVNQKYVVISDQAMKMHNKIINLF
jgi:hypothetical protein